MEPGSNQQPYRDRGARRGLRQGRRQPAPETSVKGDAKGNTAMTSAAWIVNSDAQTNQAGAREERYTEREIAAWLLADALGADRGPYRSFFLQEDLTHFNSNGAPQSI